MRLSSGALYAEASGCCQRGALRQRRGRDCELAVAHLLDALVARREELLRAALQQLLEQLVRELLDKAPPGSPEVVESAALQAVTSSTRGGGGVPSGQVAQSSPQACRAAQSRLAHPEAQGPSSGTAQGGALPMLEHGCGMPLRCSASSYSALLLQMAASALAGSVTGSKSPRSAPARGHSTAAPLGGGFSYSRR